MTQPRGLYAADTTVSPENSRAEIEKQLKRYGATRFGFEWDEGGVARIHFALGTRLFRFEVARPSFTHPTVAALDRYNRKPDRETMVKRADQIERQRWRALALFVKAALEAVDAQAIDIETIMLPYTILPNDKTLAETMGAQIRAVLDSGKMPPMLTGPNQ